MAVAAVFLFHYSWRNARRHGKLFENYLHLMQVLAESHCYSEAKHSDIRGQRLKALEMFGSIRLSPEGFFIDPF